MKSDAVTMDSLVMRLEGHQKTRCYKTKYPNLKLSGKSTNGIGIGNGNERHQSGISQFFEQDTEIRFGLREYVW